MFPVTTADITLCHRASTVGVMSVTIAAEGDGHATSASADTAIHAVSSHTTVDLAVDTPADCRGVHGHDRLPIVSHSALL